MCADAFNSLAFKSSVSAQSCAMYAFVPTIHRVCLYCVTGINILSSFIHPLVDANLYDFFRLLSLITLIFYVIKVNGEVLRLKNNTIVV